MDESTLSSPMYQSKECVLMVIYSLLYLLKDSDSSIRLPASFGLAKIIRKLALITPEQSETTKKGMRSINNKVLLDRVTRGLKSSSRNVRKECIRLLMEIVRRVPNCPYKDLGTIHLDQLARLCHAL